MSRSRSTGLAAGLGLAVMLLPGLASAQNPRRARTQLERLEGEVADVEALVSEAEKGAAKDPEKSEKELADRLVEGQLMLAERDLENAAVVFLDLLENHPGSTAAAQARYFLGETLVLMGLERWAIETFSANLADNSPDGKRHHQDSVAALLRLANPPRKPGFARRPGLSATPEVRARLRAVGVDTESKAPTGAMSDADADKARAWAEAVPVEQRTAGLTYSLGRYYFLRGQPGKARDLLDSLAPPDQAYRQGELEIRARYVAASATLASGDGDGAIERFTVITAVRARPTVPEEQQMVDLAWMALGRIHHDRGETEQAVAAYRKLSRDSVFFPEAMYETAWTLLQAQSYERAIQALDLLLIYDPDSPIVPEIKQLRGKVKVQQRDYPGAEEEFLALRREFSDLNKRLGKALDGKTDAAAYFAAVVSEDMEHFSLDALLPVEAVPIAEGLPRAVDAVELARTVGDLERQLDDARDLLERMESAVKARERARLFSDLGAYLASLDTAAIDLLEVKEALLIRARGERMGRNIDELEKRRAQLRRAVDQPLGTKNTREKAAEKLELLGERAHELDLMVAAMRAELVASERYYEQTKTKQKIDGAKFLADAATMRDEIARLEKESAALEEQIETVKTAMRFADPWMEARRKAVATYSAFLDQAYGQFKVDAADRKLWARVRKTEARVVGARAMIDKAAGRRLRKAIAVVTQERANLDRYLVELTAQHGDTRELVGDVMQAAYHDVIGEMSSLVTRSEVGLLDVAWAIQQSEVEEVQRLETNRARDLQDLDELMNRGLEELE